MLVLCCYCKKASVLPGALFKMLILNVRAYVNKYAKLLKYFYYQICFKMVNVGKMLHFVHECTFLNNSMQITVS